MKTNEEDFIYGDLSYKIIGLAYGIFNEIGFVYYEKLYQKALRIIFQKEGVAFKEQVKIPITLKKHNKKVSNCYLDFLVDDKIILELKVGSRFKKENIDQIYSYLVQNDKKLGLLINFSREGVKIKRIVNIR